MPDRRNLKDRAKSAGKSVAGTFGEGARQIKDDAKKAVKGSASKDSGTVGIKVEYDSGNDEYVVLADGKPFARYDTRKKAMKAARAAIRDRQRQINESDGGENTTETKETAEQGRFQQFATSFADKVNATAGKAASKTQAAAESMDGGDADTPEDDSGPDLAFLMGGDSGGDSGDSEPQLPFMQGAGGGEEPQLPFASDESEGSDPQLPFMQSDGGDSGLPMFGGGESDGGPEMAFGFGPMDEDNTDDSSDEQPPWMF